MYTWPMSHSTVFIYILLFPLPCWCFQWMHKYTQDSQKSAHNCTSSPSAVVRGQFTLWHWHAPSLSRSTERHRTPCTHLTSQGHPDTAFLSAGHTEQAGNSLPSPGKLRPRSFCTDWNNALTQTHLRADRLEGNHAQTHSNTEKVVVKGAPRSPARMPQILHVFLCLPKFTKIRTELQAYFWRELPADTDENSSSREEYHTVTCNRSRGTQPAPRLRAFLSEKK